MSEDQTTQPVGKPDFIEAQIVSDEVSGCDEFSGSGHTRTAKSLASTIRAFSNKDAAIGLEGAYGSGKSSVIDFTRKELEADHQANFRYKVFTFDIWAHQAESIKRGYLEELLSWAEAHPDDLIDEKYAERFRNDIRDRTVTIRTDRLNSFHWFAFVLLFFTPLLPLIISWATPIAWNGNSSNVYLNLFGFSPWGIPSNIAAQALLLSLYGLFVVSVGLAFRNPKQAHSNKTRQKTTGLKYFLERIGNAIKEGLQPFKTDKAQTETETQVIKEEDPSTTEFQFLFRGLIGEIQRARQDAKPIRLVLVFDNIDRLPASRIQHVWADIRSIFAASLPGEQPPQTKVTAIIPYDHDLIDRAFAQIGGDEDNSKFDAGSEIVSKTFITTLRVAPPIGFDGRSFFETKLAEATQNQLSSDQLWLAYRLFHLRSLRWVSPPTPRQMINYINSIVVLWNERRADIPTESLTLYAAVSDTISRESGGVFVPNKVDPELVAVAGVPDWEIHLAAIYFNVPVDHVIPLIMRRELEASLLDGAAEPIIKLQDSPHFFDALIEFISAYSGGYHAADLYYYAKILNGISQIRTKRAELAEAYRILLGIDVYDKPSVILNSVGLEFLAKRIKLCPYEQVDSEVAKWINYTFSQPPAPQFVARELVPLIDKVVTGLSKDRVLVLREQIRQFTHQAFSDEQCLSFTIATFKSKLIDANWCYPKSDSFTDQLSAALVKEPNHVVSLTKSPPDWFSPAMNQRIAGDLANALNTNIQNPEASSMPLLEALWSSYRFQPEKLEAIESVRTQGNLVLLFKYALTHENPQLAEKAFFLEGIFANSAAAPNYGNRNVGDLGSVAEAIQFYNTQIQGTAESPKLSAANIASLITSKSEDETFLRLAIQSSEGSIFREIFAQAVAIGHFSTLAWPQTFKHYSSLRTILDTDGFNSWLTQCVEEHGLPTPDTSIANTIELVGDAEKYEIEALYELADRSNRVFLEFDQSDWENLLATKPELINLLDQRLKSRLRPLKSLASAARIALLNHLSDASEGSAELSSLNGFYDSLFAALNQSSKTELPRALVEEITREPIEAGNWRKFSEAMPQLYAQLPFEIVPDNFIKNVLSPLLSSGEDLLSALLNERPSVVRQAMQGASKSTKALLSDDLRASFANGDEDQKTQVEGIANALGLPSSIFKNLPGRETD